MHKPRVLVVFGTRPEVIKLAPVVHEMRRRRDLDCCVCVTAQHRQMLDQMLPAFGLRPDYDLDLMEANQDLNSFSARALPAMQKALREARPDFVLVQGDTTTTFIAALAAFYEHVPLGHVEAGLRSFDRANPYPEEANRVLTARLAALHFAPTGIARRNLLAEGVAARDIVLTGNTVVDALHWSGTRPARFQAPELRAAIAAMDVQDKAVVVTTHRRENLGPPLEALCGAFQELVERHPRLHLFYPVHMNPQVQGTVRRVVRHPRAHLLPTLGYFDLINLLRRSRFVLTDSGGIQEEAPSLGKPVLILRRVTERPEAVSAGVAKLVGTDPRAVVSSASRLLEDPAYYDSMAKGIGVFGDGRASERIVDSIRLRFGLTRRRLRRPFAAAPAARRGRAVTRNSKECDMDSMGRGRAMDYTGRMDFFAAASSRESDLATAQKRDGVKEQRRYTRVRDPFPGTLVPVRGFLGGRPIRGLGRDYDAAGACIRTSSPLAVGTRVRVRLQLPRSISNFFRGLPCEFPGQVRSVRRREPGCGPGYDVILRWDRPLPEIVAGVVSSYQRIIGTLIALVLGAAVWLKWRTLSFFWYDPFFFIYSLTLMTYLLSRFVIAWRHSVPPRGEYEPTVSIVISVRNEEAAITRTVEACFLTEYPAQKREVIVVDDGSSDGTGRKLRELGQRFASLRVFTLMPSGKRHGMATGVKNAHGEIIVFVDSDTFLMPDALRHIVRGFEDPSLGASAGYCDVENASTNVLTGLQEVRYYVSFRLLKSAESFFSCVTCCSGCLSAYRREYVLEVLEPWLKQTFLGAPATFGDDRSLTNFILRKYRVIYNDFAAASTMVPETWRHYLCQQVRWKKSWLRETLIAACFMYKKHPIAAISFYAAAVFSLLSPIMVFRVIFLELHGHNSALLYYILGLTLVGLLQSLYFLYRRPSPHWLLGMLWMASSLLITGPQTYYAMLTMRKNHWGTR